MTTTNTTNNLQIERFKFLSYDILEHEKRVKYMSQERDNLFSSLLKECPKLFEDAICKWAKSNPIDAISYIHAKETFTNKIYYDNGTGYELLFERDINEENIYTLYDKETLIGYSVSESKIKEYYSSIKNTSNMSLTLDFLNGYNVNIIKDEGHFNDQLHWVSDVKVDECIIPTEYVCKFLYKHFTLVISNIDEEPNEITFSKKGVIEFSKTYTGDFLSNLTEYNHLEDIYLISNAGTPVGLIEFRLIEYMSNIYLDAIEFPKENQKKGYGYKAIRALQNIFPHYTVSGFYGENEGASNLFKSLGSIYLGCKQNCTEYNEGCKYSDNERCDEPYDFRFKLESLDI